MTQVRRGTREPSASRIISQGSAPGATVGEHATGLLPRVLSGLFLIVTALGSLWLGGDWFGLFWLLAGLAIHYEWQTLVADARPLARFAVGAVAFALVTRLSLEGYPQAGLVVVAVTAAATALLAEPHRRLWAGAGVLYGGALLVAVTMLRTSDPHGVSAVLWLFAVVWSNDIMAFFGGRLIGGPKLWPAISPSKTWAGVVVGNIAGAVAGLLVVPVASGTAMYLLLGLLCGVAAQAGDLAESAVKRHFGVKDTGSIIPGHGGVMDRLDGFVAAAVLTAGIGVLYRGFGNAGAGLFFW